MASALVSFGESISAPVGKLNARAVLVNTNNMSATSTSPYLQDVLDEFDTLIALFSSTGGVTKTVGDTYWAASELVGGNLSNSYVVVGDTTYEFLAMDGEYPVYGDDPNVHRGFGYWLCYSSANTYTNPATSRLPPYSGWYSNGVLTDVTVEFFSGQDASLQAAISAATPGGYAAVSNAAMNAADIDTLQLSLGRVKPDSKPVSITSSNGVTVWYNTIDEAVSALASYDTMLIWSRVETSNKLALPFVTNTVICGLNGINDRQDVVSTFVGSYGAFSVKGLSNTVKNLNILHDADWTNATNQMYTFATTEGYNTTIDNVGMYYLGNYKRPGEPGNGYKVFAAVDHRLNTTLRNCTIGAFCTNATYNEVALMLLKRSTNVVFNYVDFIASGTKYSGIDSSGLYGISNKLNYCRANSIIGTSGTGQTTYISETDAYAAVPEYLHLYMPTGTYAAESESVVFEGTSHDRSETTGEITITHALDGGNSRYIMLTGNTSTGEWAAINGLYSGNPDEEYWIHGYETGDNTFVIHKDNDRWLLYYGTWNPYEIIEALYESSDTNVPPWEAAWTSLTGSVAPDIGYVDAGYGDRTLVRQQEETVARQIAKHTGTNWLYYASETNQVYSYWDYANTQKVTVVIYDGETNTYYSLNQ